MENVKAGSECPEGADRILSPPSGPNRDPTPSGASSPTRPISDWMQFGNRTIRPSGEEEVAGSGLGRSLGSIPWNRPPENADKSGRGIWVDEWLMGCNYLFFFIV